MDDPGSLSLEGDSIISVRQYAAPSFFHPDQRNLRVRFESGLKFELIPHKTGWLSLDILDKDQHLIWSTINDRFLADERNDYVLDLKGVLGKSGFVIKQGGFLPHMIGYRVRRSILLRQQILNQLYLLSPDGMIFMVYASARGNRATNAADFESAGFKAHLLAH